LREPTIDALRCRLAPADALGHSVEHGEIPWVLDHELAAEFERVLVDRLGELVHEAFQEDAVLVAVHAAPESRRHVRVPHGVVDQ
jgi:hypothetical protein